MPQQPVNSKHDNDSNALLMIQKENGNLQLSQSPMQPHNPFFHFSAMLESDDNLEKRQELTKKWVKLKAIRKWPCPEQ